MDSLQTWIKQLLGQNLLGIRTDFNLGFYVTLIVKVKLFNLSKIVITLTIMNGFYRYMYLDKGTLMTQLTF